MSIVTLDNFTGFAALSSNVYTEEELQQFIETNEPVYLCQLLGQELADLLLSDLVDGEPQSQRFIDLFTPFCIKDGCKQWLSEGLRFALVVMIYSDYVKDNDTGHTISGTTYQQNEVSGEPNLITTARKAESRKNRGVLTYRALQWFMCKNKTIYPEFDGVYKSVSFLGLI